MYLCIVKCILLCMYVIIFYINFFKENNVLNQYFYALHNKISNFEMSIAAEDI